MKVGSWESHRVGDRYVCDTCGTSIRGQQFRYHPPKSGMYERCIGFAWCSTCSIFTGTMVHVPRRVQLVDPLAGLPAAQRESLWRDESKLIEHLDRLARPTDES